MFDRINSFKFIVFCGSIFAQSAIAGGAGWICYPVQQAVAAGEYSIGVISENPKAWSDSLSEALEHVVELNPEYYQGVKFIPVPISAVELSSDEGHEGMAHHGEMKEGDMKEEKLEFSTVIFAFENSNGVGNPAGMSSDIIVVDPSFVESHSKDKATMMNASKHVALAITSRASETRAPMFLQFTTQHLLEAPNLTGK